MMSMKSPENWAAEARRTPELRSALEQLADAKRLAASVSLPSEDLALELPGLIYGGSSSAALKCLVAAGLVFCLGGQAGRELIFTEGSRFLLSPAGAEVAIFFSRNGIETMPDEPRKPRWDANGQELWVCGQLIKRLTGQAGNQALVLTAFQEEGWPARIDDPLPGDKRVDAHKRLLNTIQRLNGYQLVRLLRFRADGTGCGIRWEQLRLR